MSHISRIKTQITDRDLLLETLANLGYEVEQGDLHVSSVGGQKTPVDIKIRLRLSNDIGFRKSGEFYEIVADWFGVRGEKQKEFTNKVTQGYAYRTVKSKLREQGFTLVEETQQKGTIQLVLRRTV